MLVAISILTCDFTRGLDTVPSFQVCIFLIRPKDLHFQGSRRPKLSFSFSSFFFLQIIFPRKYLDLEFGSAVRTLKVSIFVCGDESFEQATYILYTHPHKKTLPTFSKETIQTLCFCSNWLYETAFDLRN